MTLIAPTKIYRFASGSATGTVLSGLFVDKIEWHSFDLVDVYFSGSPTMTAVAAGHFLNITGATNTANIGRFLIVEKDPAAFRLRIKMTAAISHTSTYDEDPSPAEAVVENGGPALANLPPEKEALGFFWGEYPSADQLNSLLKNFGDWNYFFATGGAIMFRENFAAWKVLERENSGAEIINGQGWYRFDPEADDTPGEGFIAPATSPGIGIIESAHPDAMAAMLAAFVPEILPPVQAVLNFDSVSAGAVGTPLTVTVPGAVFGDQVILGPPAGIDAGLMWAGFVSAADTVQIRLFNGTGSPINPAEATWSVTVIRPNSMPVITTRGLKIFTNLIGGVYTSGTLETDLGIADNEAAFNLLVNSRQHRAAMLDGGTIEAIISGSATADAIILATGGY